MKTPKFRTQLQDRYAGWFPSISAFDRARLESLLTYINILRLRLTAWLIIAFMLILIVMYPQQAVF